MLQKSSYENNSKDFVILFFLSQCQLVSCADATEIKRS